MDKRLPKKYEMYYRITALIGGMCLIIGFSLGYFTIEDIIIYESEIQISTLNDMFFSLFNVIMGGYCLINYYEFKRKTEKYIPGLGHGFLRMPRLSRVRFIEKTAIIAIPVFLLLIVLPLFEGLLVFSVWFSACFILYSFLLIFVIRRIGYHEKIDDATLFELQRLEIIKDSDVVTSLYKDFYSWNQIKVNSVVLVLTMDNLIILEFNSRESAKKTVFPLLKLDKLRILRYGAGYLVTITSDKECQQILIRGASYQDSPEEFVHQLLTQIDACILNANKEMLSNAELYVNKIRIIDLR